MDNKVLEQVTNVAMLPGIQKASFAMPDAHWSYGFPIGGVITHLVRQTFAEIVPKANLKLIDDVSHNTCKVEEHAIDGEKKLLFVHRKGATRAFGPGHPDLPEALKHESLKRHFRARPATIGVPSVLLHSKNDPSYITTS